MIERISNEIVDIIINDKQINIKEFNWFVSECIIGSPLIIEKHNGYFLVGYSITSLLDDYELFR